MSGAARGTACLALALLLGGCGAVLDARRTQREVEGRATGEARLENASREIGTNLAAHVAYALVHRPSMASAWLAVEDARLALREIAASAPLASLTPWNAIGADGTLGHSESSDSAHFDKLKTRTEGKGTASLSLDILLYDFGRNAANARAQAERVVAAELEATSAGYSVFEDVAEAYFMRLQTAALLEVALTNAQMRAEHLEQAEQRLDAGEAKPLDVLRARLDLAESRELVVAASNNFENACATFANTLGLEASQGRELWAGEPGGADGIRRGFGETHEDAASLFAFARTNAPACLVSRARLRAASAALDYAIADLRPTVSASVALNWTDPLWYWRWGVNAAQSLFTGWRRTTAVERATVALKSAAADVDEAELKLSLALEIAVEERDNAREAFLTAEASVKSARENLETVSEQLLVGDVSRIEYTDAVADLMSALANRVKAFYRGQIAESKLFALTGRPPRYWQAGEPSGPESPEGEGT